MSDGLRFLSICSGMEAASSAWNPLGWEAGAFSEIEPACFDLLAHHHPDTPNLGDMTAPDFIERAKKHGPYDVVCGGTPCQSFSIAGLRKSLQDDRGNLTLKFVEICNEINPDIIVWENVKDVLNTEDNAFGCFLAGLVGESTPLVTPGGKWTYAGYVAGPERTVAWRLLDAQYFGVAQRRRRVFLVGIRAGIGVHPGQILFEPESVRRHTAPSREKGEGTTRDVKGGIGGGGVPEVTNTLTPGDHLDRVTDHTPVVFDTTQVTSKTNRSNPQPGDPCHTLAKGAHPPAIAIRTAQPGMKQQNYIAFMAGQGSKARSIAACEDISPTLKGCPSGLNQSPSVCYRTSGNCGVMEQGDKTAALTQSTDRTSQIIQQQMAVRRLMPIECERLQGFSDNYSLIPRKNGKMMADGPRYKMIGNSWAVPVPRWIGERIDKVLKQQRLVSKETEV